MIKDYRIIATNVALAVPGPMKVGGISLQLKVVSNGKGPCRPAEPPPKINVLRCLKVLSQRRFA